MKLKRKLGRFQFYKMLCVLLGMVMLLSGIRGVIPASAASNLSFTFDLGGSGKIIENKFSQLLIHGDFRTTNASNFPSDYFSKNYPFAEKVEIIDATGGSAALDLFVDPNDRTTLTDYKFDSLMLTCRNLVRQGLKPYLVTGNVPLKFCANPYISPSFNVNVRPPDNFWQYYEYIKAVATALVDEFGLDEVKTWSWGVLTEFDNKDWFCDADGTPESTRLDYFKLYDFTVTALQDVIGAENLTVGAHAMICSPGLWDVGDFIDHCAFGCNYGNGYTGTQLNFLTTSYYDTRPGIFPAKTLDSCINQLRNRALADGLKKVKFAADEGRILNGADGKPITAREVGMSYQGAADARLFKDMIDNDISWYAARAVNTETFWGGIDTVSAHIANLGYKMTGDTYHSPTKSGTPANASDQIDGIGGYNNNTKTAHIMLYNFNANPSATYSEPVTVKVNNIGFEDGTDVTVKQWIVDDTHANFWPTWWQDMTKRGIDYSSSSWSMYSTTVPGLLKNPDDRAFWYANTDKYSALAELKSTESNATVQGGSITLTQTLAHHGVVFYEITENQPDPPPQVTITDELNNWSASNSHSAGLYFDTGNSDNLGDNSRVARAAAGATQTQNIVYKLADINSFTATALYASTSDPVLAKFQFYTSPDGTSWTEQTGCTMNDSFVNGVSWTKRVYSFDGAPVGTNYLKVEFPTTGLYTWNPQLSTVSVTGYLYEPGDVNGDVTVDLKDVTKLARYVAGWYPTLNGNEIKRMDVNGDNKVDLMDVTLLSRFVAGWNIVIH